MSTSFTDLEVAALLEDDWEADKDSGQTYVKRRIVQLGCGCCSEVDVLIMTKTDRGYGVFWYPHQGAAERFDTPSFAEAIDWL